jgi:hypothetical protein
MKPVSLLLLLWAVIDVAHGPTISFLSNVRDVRITAPGRQNYFVVDEELWQHARPDLADLRLFDGSTQVPYAVTLERGGVSSAETPAKILNLGSVAGKTEFDLDSAGIPEYDHVRLQLESKNFVSNASVMGKDAPGKGAGTLLGSSTLYDFSTENLGSNFTLKVHPVSFRYLHVRISGSVRPQDVKGATISNLQEQKARWTKVGSCEAPRNQARTTLISCYVAPPVPVDRIQFQVDPQQVNFRRTVSLTEMQGLQVASGELGRVKIARGGTLVTAEDLTIDAGGRPAGHFTISIDNADNPALHLIAVQPLSIERRVYFDPQTANVLKLYYGDPRLAAPVYDYAKFFHAEASAEQDELGPGSPNPAYTGRPDERPWSERHKAILWIAMLIAVVLLARLALRGLLAPNKPQA